MPASSPLATLTLAPGAASDLNTVLLSGTLGTEIHYAVFGEQQQPELRFDLLVLRQRTTRQTKNNEVDLVRVIMQGHYARIIYFYLKAAGRVTVQGRLQSRFYNEAKRGRRRVMEVVAEVVNPGPGCDFERGERQRKQLLEETQGPNTDYGALGLVPVTLSAEDLAAEA